MVVAKGLGFLWSGDVPQENTGLDAFPCNIPAGVGGIILFEMSRQATELTATASGIWPGQVQLPAAPFLAGLHAWVRAFRDDLKASVLQKHFWFRNELYALTDPRRSLISQQTRPPSERTINPRLALKSPAFFPDVTRECYHCVHGTRSCLVRREVGQ